MVSRLQPSKPKIRLSMPVMMDRSLHKTAFDIAHAIAGEGAKGAILGQALIVAEYELMLTLSGIERYERRAYSRKKRGIGAPARSAGDRTTQGLIDQRGRRSPRPQLMRVR
jgi:hypothetical protein